MDRQVGCRGGGGYMKLMNRLQSHDRELKKFGISLAIPKVVVVGGQSTGKSSTLENIGQQTFLPTGGGTVTKCPIELRFVKDDNHGYSVGGQEFKNPHQVRRSIETLSEQFSRADGGISSSVIEVAIRASSIPNMTLIDLPGLIKVHSSEEQQTNATPKKIKALVSSYLSNDKTVVVMVASATEDFQGYAVTKQVQDADPEGRRSFVVFTKLDKVVTEEEKKSFLKSLAVARERFKLGAVGVVNPGPKDSREMAAQKEAAVLRHIFGQSQEAERHGIAYLQHQVELIQLSQTVDCLPLILQEMTRHIRDQDTILQKVGVEKFLNKRGILISALSKFGKDFSGEIEGYKHDFAGRGISGGVIVTDVLRDELYEKLKGVDPWAGINVTEAFAIGVANPKGARGINFLLDGAVANITAQGFKSMEPVCKDTLAAVYKVMRTIVSENAFVGCPSFQRFPGLKQLVLRDVHQMLEEPKNKVEARIEEYIKTQAEVPYSCAESFTTLKKELKQMIVTDAELEYARKCKDDGVDVMAMVGEGNPDGSPEATLAARLTFLKSLVDAYFAEVKQQVVDYIHKLIMQHLVYKASVDITATMTSLVMAAVERSDEDRYIVEDPGVEEARQEALQKKARLELCFQDYNEVRRIVHGNGLAEDMAAADGEHFEDAII